MINAIAGARSTSRSATPRKPSLPTPLALPTISDYLDPLLHVPEESKLRCRDDIDNLKNKLAIKGGWGPVAMFTSALILLANLPGIVAVQFLLRDELISSMSKSIIHLVLVRMFAVLQMLLVILAILMILGESTTRTSTSACSSSMQ